MYSIKFPKMVSSVNTNLVEDHKATSQNLILMLKSDRRSLFGDPYFGTILKRLIYEQNNVILKDIIIDELYSSIITFMPQISLERGDITITSSKDTLYATIACTNLLDKKTDLYTIKLTEDSNED